MNQLKTYKIKGMHCASCASVIEKTFKKTDGVLSAEANYGTESVKVSFDEAKIHPEALSKKIEHFGYSLILPTAEEMNMSPDEHAAHLGLNQSKKEKLTELAEMKSTLMNCRSGSSNAVMMKLYTYATDVPIPMSVSMFAFP